MIENALFEVSWEGDVAIITLCDRADANQSALMYRFQLPLIDFLDQHRPKKTVVDFAGLDRLAGELLGEAITKGPLVTAGKRVSDYGGRLALCGMTATVQECYRISRLDTFFVIVDSVPEAMRSFDTPSD